MKVPNNTAQRRFSLVELLVVIGIFTIVASMAAVAIAPMMRGRSLRAGARTVQTALRQARSYAAHSNQNTTVWFDHEQEAGLIEIACFLICRETGHDDLIFPGQNCPHCGHDNYTIPDLLFETSYLPDGIQFDHGKTDDHITFTPMGSLQGNTNKKATIQNLQMNQKIEITVIGSSGLVRTGEIVEAQ